jgi:hypothetical protein
MATITIVNQEINDERGIYRIQHGRKVGYVTIPIDVFDEATMCRPYLLIPKLPKLPDEDWTRMHISKSSTNGSPEALNVQVTNEPLPSVDTTFHNQRIDVLSLARIKRYRSNVHEVLYNGEPAICKIAIFDWEIPRLERETWAYSILDQYQLDHPDMPPLTPRVLGHVTEQGRITGLLLERLEGVHASLEDLSTCAAALRRLHGMGLVHGDVNRYNFLVDEQNGGVCMVDFEHASALELDVKMAEEELASLASELEEVTGRGGPSRIV